MPFLIFPIIVIATLIFTDFTLDVTNTVPYIFLWCNVCLNFENHLLYFSFWTPTELVYIMIFSIYFLIISSCERIFWLYKIECDNSRKIYIWVFQHINFFFSLIYVFIILIIAWFATFVVINMDRLENHKFYTLIIEQYNRIRKALPDVSFVFLSFLILKFEKQNVKNLKPMLRGLIEKYKNNFQVWKLFNTKSSKLSLYQIYLFSKNVLLSLLFAFIFFIYALYFFKFSFVRQLAVWYLLGITFFWLISGFNFFLKRYRFGKFTSAIQRFWKRTNICFWAVEGFLFVLYFFYYLNSSQEPLYMYDTSNLSQDFTLNLTTGYFNFLNLSVIILVLYTLIMLNQFFAWNQLNVMILITTVYILKLFFIESYQFYYLLSTFYETTWVLNEDGNTWNMQLENPKYRTKLYYYSMCLIAKYWHFIFIFLSWIFFVIKSFEQKHISITMLALMYQNFLILYVLNLLCYVQWFKWIFRRFFDTTYFWFFITPDYKNIYIFINEVYIYICAFLNNIFNFELKNINFLQFVVTNILDNSINLNFLVSFKRCEILFLIVNYVYIESNLFANLLLKNIFILLIIKD